MKNLFYHIIGVIFITACSVLLSHAYGQNNADSIGFSENKDKRLVYDVIDQLFSSAERIVPTVKPSSEIPQAGDIQVFGWHPYWLGDSYLNYDYSLLTTASYFSCTMTLNEYGNIEYATNGWEAQAGNQIISMAKADDCNIILTLRCHEQSAIEKLLSDEVEQAYCIQYLTELVSETQIADGINITFEDIPLGYRSEFSVFLSDLSVALKSLDKSLVLTLPAVPDKRKYNIQELDGFIDQFVVMGYNYYYSGSDKPGPVSPLESGDVWGDLNLKKSLSSYLKKGINKKKLIMALPFYGAIWELDTLETGEVESTFFEHRRINKIILDLKGATPLYDTTAYTAYYSYTENDKDYICYFDDAYTLRHKFNWIKNQGIAGVGIWALGYDSGEKELWRMIDDNFTIVKNPGFSVSTTTTTDTVLTAMNIKDLQANGLTKLKDDATNIFQQKEVLIVIGCILLGCILIGVLLAFMSNTVYEKILIQEMMVYLKISGVFILFIIVCVLVANFVLVSDESIAEVMELNKSAPVVISGDVVSSLIKVGIAGWMIITLLSWKVFLKLNKDIP